MRLGFSLVELSIVLVILGLLTGGILAGQSLIRAAELRSITNDLNRFLAATQLFRSRYMGLPGDMPNAQSFWGVESSANCTYTNSTGSTTQLTCNGDGDGMVKSRAGVAVNTNEQFRFWQHLANAGLIEGTYTGASNGGSNENIATSAVNVPKSRLSNVAWFTYNWNQYNGVGFGTSPVIPALPEFGNFFLIGTATSNNYPFQAAFTPAEAWNIDTKMDDGKPGYGKISPLLYTTCTDASAITQLVADYNVSNSDKACSLIVIKAY